MITVDDCKHIENLAKFIYTDEERESVIKEFSTIVEFASTILNAKCDNPKCINSLKLDDLRDDEVGESFSQDEVVTNAPMKKKGCFAVPKIMD